MAAVDYDDRTAFAGDYPTTVSIVPVNSIW